MPTDAITGWPYDSAQDAPDGAAQMLRLITAVNAGGGNASPILHAVDAADRDAKYPNPNPGAICTTTGAPWTIWFFTNTWLEVFSDSGWITTGFTAGSGWSIGSYMRASKVGVSVFIEGEVTYTAAADLRGAASTDPSPGNLSPDQTVVTVPPKFCPGGTNNGGVAGQGKASGTGGSVQLYPSGNVVLSDITTNGKISTGDFLRFSFTFRAGS